MTQLGTKKSRNGCRQCKRRHVKCDEESPCGNCMRRGEGCSLAQSSPGGSSHREVRDSSLPSSTQEWVQDMELMHHYSSYGESLHFNARDDLLTSYITVSHQPLGIRQGAGDLWKKIVPEEAMKHPFLLHGVLALSALSLAYLRPAEAQKYLTLFDKHQNIAMPAYRSILAGQITEEVSTALFALASVTSISSMARSCAVVAIMPIPRYLNMDEITELFYLTRGVRDVIHAAHDYIVNGPIYPMFIGHVMPDAARATVTLPRSTSAQFTQLYNNLVSRSANPHANPENLAICATALGDLENIYLNLRYFGRQEQLETAKVWRWTTMVPTEFVRLIHVRDPVALVILAYFAAATAGPVDAWYTAHWAEYALEGISRELEASEIRHWLDWPRAQIASQLKAVIFDDD